MMTGERGACEGGGSMKRREGRNERKVDEDILKTEDDKVCVGWR